MFTKNCFHAVSSLLFVLFLWNYFRFSFWSYRSSDLRDSSAMVGVRTDKQAHRQISMSTRCVDCSGMKSRSDALKRVCDGNKIQVLMSETGHFDARMFSFILTDDRHRLLFCAIPKAASTTWKTILAKATGDPMASNIPVHQVEDQRFMERIGLRFLSSYSEPEINTRLRTYFKFVSVRHPLDRLVSAYWDKISRVNPYGDGIRRRILEEQMPRGINKTSGGRNRIGKISFQDFISFVVKELQNRRELDHHWSDYASLCHPCHIHYDYISKMETFVHDVEFLQRRLGLNIAQPHTNRSIARIPIYNSHQRSPRRDVRSSRDVEIKGCQAFARWRKSLKEFENVSSADFKQILKLYSRDMEMFGYAWNGDLLEAECDGLCC